MNFVIFSYHFLPQSDAESSCTTRFASALASAGHDVQVVTMDWPKGVSDDVYDFLVDKRIRITRVPITGNARPNLFWRLRYLTDEYGVVDFPACIRALKAVLQATPDAILISRSCPLASIIVSYHCRQYAKMWINHFSDPLSYFDHSGIKGRLRYWFTRHWIEKALRFADAISLTCEAVKRYYHDEHGSLFDRAYCYVTPHIGDPMLPVTMHYDRAYNGAMIAHAGFLSDMRGGSALIEAIDALNREEIPARLFLCGPMGPDTQDRMKKSANVVEVEKPTHDLTSAVCDAADIIFIADQDTELGYIPFVPSKFAYQIYTDKPIVILTRKGSTMAECCRRHPTAGLYQADFDNPVGTLTLAFKQAHAQLGARFDRVALRLEYSREKAVRATEDACLDRGNG